MDFLSYFALAINVFVFLTLAYGIIAIHDIPYNIEGAEPPASGCDPRGGVGACHLAVPLDMGNDLPSGGYVRRGGFFRVVPGVCAHPVFLDVGRHQRTVNR